MDAISFELIGVLLAVLAFGSSIIHYSAYTKSKLNSTVKKKL